MEEGNKKYKELSEEMSRFEYEAFGNVIPVPKPFSPPRKTINGSNIINQNNEQLKKANDVLPITHNFNLNTTESFPSFYKHPCISTSQHFLPPQLCPPRAFRPPQNSLRPSSTNFGPMNYRPPFMRPEHGAPNFMMNNFPQRINPPPQYNRPPYPPMSIPSIAPAGINGFNHFHSTFSSLPSNSKVEMTSPAIITKTSVISSAPKLYSNKNGQKVAKKRNNITQNDDLSLIEPEEKKVKIEVTTKSNAVQMAKKVQDSAVTTTYVSKSASGKKKVKSTKNLRYGGGQVWKDETLSEWKQGDYRLFAGNLGIDISNEHLTRFFSHYPSFLKAKVICDKKTGRSKGYGFISFGDPKEYVKAVKEVNGKFIGSRPIALKKSTWADRDFHVVQKKLEEKKRMGLK